MADRDDRIDLQLRYESNWFNDTAISLAEARAEEKIAEALDGKVPASVGSMTARYGGPFVGAAISLTLKSSDGELDAEDWATMGGELSEVSQRELPSDF